MIVHYTKQLCSKKTNTFVCTSSQRLSYERNVGLKISSVS